ncbi:CU044_2847 family protein [Streptomyces winkii]|uniref:CU044_2847 family protein n=1 Tax=Streptomyces winkii TaxID=3051178 RepID=UPI0028D083AA|nr:CU044_2847 family protein [Streptomyces sp. DSM 40971]
MPLEGGGAILFEDVEGASDPGGPVKAGRVGDAIRELPRTVQESLVPVREAARALMDQLKEAGPQEVEAEFGLNLSARAGAVITGAETTAHVRVRLVWKHGGSDQDDVRESR